MRTLLLGCCFSGLLSLIGCSTNEQPTASIADAKGDGTECKSGDCCSSLSRAKLLEKTENEPDETKTELTCIAASQLSGVVKKYRGKVVCMFAWAIYHPPSMIHLPAVIELQHKHAKTGLVCITVADGQTESAHENTSKFLIKMKCDLRNVLVTDHELFFGGSWGSHGIPAMIVFGRDGKQAAMFDCSEKTPFNMAVIETTVQRLLKAK